MSPEKTPQPGPSGEVAGGHLVTGLWSAMWGHGQPQRPVLGFSKSDQPIWVTVIKGPAGHGVEWTVRKLVWVWM